MNEVCDYTRYREKALEYELGEMAAIAHPLPWPVQTHDAIGGRVPEKAQSTSGI